jgi:spermidine synthase
MPLLLYLMFFVSGAAGLVYEVAWVRSLGLVFGASHLAVTTVLAVYMGGLALGAALLGRRADASKRPLRLYGYLELGVAAFALVFIGLMEIYPSIYVPLVRLAEENRAYRTILRVAFGTVAMIVPTTLMGGTLPVLARFVTARGGGLGRHLSFLYAFNTLGAVAGSLAAGFLLLKSLGVTGTLLAAMVVNLVIGLAAVFLPERIFAGEEPAPPRKGVRPGPKPEVEAVDGLGPASGRLVLWGIGVSGFCALGYEILWTRMLTLVVGTSVYSFTIMLVAFLAGIALGSQAFGLTLRSGGRPRARRLVLAFGAVQAIIGVAALGVTILMRDLPSHATALQSALSRGAGEFGARQGASFAVAFAYMFVPAFFMGVAFPLAGTIHAGWRERVGGAVGEVFTYNTIGAILGSAASGFVLIYAFGAERSLQMLSVVNVGIGLAVGASLLRWRAAPWVIAAGAAALLVALGADRSWGRYWDVDYFAIFRNNQRGAFDTPERIREALEHTHVLYYFEGANETISVIQPKGSQQAFIVNGRPEATTSPGDVQCQRTLGHLPMLLHPNPRKVFVLGTGTGMTLGATSIHPEVERIVLAEIEPGVIGATRTFADWNHRVLDDPRLKIVFNDGRNFLATTREKFDVITADPIHPWSGGAAYLYTKEYFDSVAAHLTPGGIATQWLPIYELTVRDVKTVLRTFSESFRYVLVWLTYVDAEIVGSNAPLAVDEAALARRMARPEIARDLASVLMGTPEQFLSYFVMGTEGVQSYRADGVVNTDDNLFLEFSAPESIGLGHLMGENVTALAAAREGLLPYLVPASGDEVRAEQRARWERNLSTARLCDRAHALHLWGRNDSELRTLMAELGKRAPEYGPYLFLRRQLERADAAAPRLADETSFPVGVPGGGQRMLRLSAVTMRIGDARAVVMFVDNDRRVVYGERYIDAPPDALEALVARFASETTSSLRREYVQMAEEARRRGEAVPSEAHAAERLKRRVEAALVAPVP